MAIPPHQALRRPILESLRDGAEHDLSEIVAAVARRLRLSTEDQKATIPAGTHTLLYDRVMWARWYLAKAGLLSIPRRGVTAITTRGLKALDEAPEVIDRNYLSQFPEYREYIESTRGRRLENENPVLNEFGETDRTAQPLVWIEKTLVSGRPDRESGDYALGKALWSPKASESGADIYRFMRDVAPGDVVLHLTDNEAFTGLSIAASRAEDFIGVSGTPWSDTPSYIVRLTDFRRIDPPLKRDIFFSNPFRERLTSLIDFGHKNLFYNRAPALNQGAYLTPAPPALVRILNDAYVSVAGSPLIEGLVASVSSTAEEAIDDAKLFDRLVKRTYWTEAALSNIIQAIRHPITPSRQIILAGPPGTSKTFLAQELISYLTRNDVARMRVVQFHPSYSYEQFIEGLRPVVDQGAIRFEVVKGIVLEMAAQCRASDEDHFLLIDELNRANLSRVLGELMYLFEYRDRDIDLPYTRRFSLPPNLYFIGTMNTADRSIRSIDLALRRRFDVFDCPPDASVLTRFYETDNTNEVPDLIEGFTKLNARLREEMQDEYHAVGHAFFMSKHFTADDLAGVWYRKIKPLLGDYFFASPEIANSFELALFWPSMSK